MANFVSLDPAALDDTRRYDILVGAVEPRPIALVSTVSRDGIPNLGPFSFFMLGGANPPSLFYSPTINKRGARKDSLRNVEDTGEFVVNAVTRDMVGGMNAASFEFPDSYNEWQAAGFTAIASELVGPARVAESPFQLECKLFRVVEHGDGPGAARYVIGEVVRMHIREDVYDGYGVDLDRYRPLSRMGGQDYLDTKSLQMFSLQRPTGLSGAS